MEPSNDAETVESQGEVTSGVLPSSRMLATKDIKGTLTYDGRYIRYILLDNIFEVTAKYQPPISPVGSGACGIVCSAMDTENNENVAIKKIMHVVDKKKKKKKKKKKIIMHAFDNIIEAKRTLREIKLLRHFNHENIVGIRDVIVPPQRDSFEDVYIVYELMGYDLSGIITSKEIVLSNDHCMFFLYQILRGLKYIHSANVLHRDLKPSNLLVNKNSELKICDFGLARATPESHLMTQYVVTRWYRAPELVLNSADYTAAIDIWSVGCIYMEVLNGTPLFPGQDQVHQLRLLMELLGTPSEEELGALSENAKRYIRQLPRLPRQSFSEKFPNVDPLAIDLMEKMLTFDPRRRISVKEALAHPYLSSYHDISDEPECTVPFNFDLEETSLTEEQIKELIYCEALDFQ